MNYLKKFESFQTHDEIHKICRKYNITNYTINEDGSIDVDYNVNLAYLNLTELPVKFNHVNGYFTCNNNNLTTLEGGPVSVEGLFNCENNKLTTLEGAPLSVGGNFWCNDNRLTTLEGAPKSVNYFNCGNNKLTTLEGAPQSVPGKFICHNNKLTTLEGAPKSVNYFNCGNNKLTTLEGAPQSVPGKFICHNNKLTTLEGAPQSVGSFYCHDNKQLKSLYYLPKYIYDDKVDFTNTAVHEIFKLFDADYIGYISGVATSYYRPSMIRYVNDFKLVVDDKIDIEILNALLYDHGKPPVENVKGYDNI